MRQRGKPGTKQQSTMSKLNLVSIISNFFFFKFQLLINKDNKYNIHLHSDNHFMINQSRCITFWFQSEVVFRDSDRQEGHMTWNEEKKNDAKATWK